LKIKKINKSKHIAAFGVITLSIAAVALGVQQLASIYTQEEQLLPPIPLHADPAKQMPLSFSDSLNIKL
jgi:hypothetical protein